MQDILCMLKAQTINMMYKSLGLLKHDKTNTQNEGYNSVKVWHISSLIQSSIQFDTVQFEVHITKIEPLHEISNNVVCA